MDYIKNQTEYNKYDAISIFDYSKRLLGRCLRDFVSEERIQRSGKGGLGQMVEELYFGYKVNPNPKADFAEAGLELKCTPLKTSAKGEYLIKERLVCNMIDYMSVINEDFEHSHFYLKCQLMLILFYLHDKDASNYDLQFIFSVLWRLPQKDLLIIKHDYEIILGKIKAGLAHTLSEGDTMYLGACRKGQKGDKLQVQPYSKELAPKRAFSLKPAYMRTVLNYVQQQHVVAACNYDTSLNTKELVKLDELKEKTFEEIILDKFTPYYKKNYISIATELGQPISKSKSKYAIIANGIVSTSMSNVDDSEEFKKAGITLKTVRVEESGSIKESMSFENIDYCEVYDESDWFDSRLYEIFSSRFLFVVYKATGRTIRILDKEEKEYILDKVFFWTMPQRDLLDAEVYWKDIRNNILNNQIDLANFFKKSDKKKFHVRPKGTKTSYKDAAENPLGGTCDKYCYWFNSDFVRSIIESN